jgi:uncharacterized protein (TIRG00374 family)
MWKKALTAISLVAGLALFVMVIQRFGGFAKALEAVASIGPLGVLLFTLNAAGTMIFPAVGWWILMRSDGLRVPFRATLKANFMGFPINYLAPSMYLGAEPLKLIYLANLSGEPKRKILATIIVSKFQEIGALLFTMIAACGIALWRIEFTREQEIALASAMGLLLVLFAGALYAFVGDLRPTVKLINLLARFFRKGRRRLARLRTRAEEMEHLIRAAFTQRRGIFLAAQAATLLSSLSIFLRPSLYAAYCREPMNLELQHLSAIYLLTNLVNLLPHTPGALGVMEGVMGILFGITRMGTEHARDFQVVVRVADLLLLLTGGWLIVHHNLQSLARRVAEGKERVRLEDAEGALPVHRPPPGPSA